MGEETRVFAQEQGAYEERGTSCSATKSGGGRHLMAFCAPPGSATVHETPRSRSMAAGMLGSVKSSCWER
jgi:hypothetical protein